MTVSGDGARLHTAGGRGFEREHGQYEAPSGVAEQLDNSDEETLVCGLDWGGRAAERGFRERSELRQTC